MKQNETNFAPKSAVILLCETCDFKCCKKSDYDRHLSTRKHIMKQNETKLEPKSATDFGCGNCKKIFNSRTTLWRHTKKCSINERDENNKKNNIISNDNFKIDKEFVMTVLKQNNDILKQNNDLQTQVMELLKNGTHNTTNNNKTFNLNFFLNETCKNAMNIMDFVNSLQLQLSDLEKMGEIGYVNGMSNIIIKNLKDMDVTERPVHCTDMKREVLYVKDEDKWDKETNEKPKIRKAIKYVARKNARLLQEFKEKHPDCNNSDSKYSDTYNKLMIEAMGGKGYDDKEQEGKIIKRLSKEITINS